MLRASIAILLGFCQAYAWGPSVLVSQSMLPRTRKNWSRPLLFVPMSCRHAAFSLGAAVTGEDLAPTRQSSYELPSLQPKSSRNEDIWGRARELLCIISTGIVFPLFRSVLQGGLMQGWKSFWAAENNGISNAERLRIALEKMGPTYVKFGQAVSTRPDIVTEPLADALSVLQDRMQSFDSNVARAIVQEDLMATGLLSRPELEAFIESMSPLPIASASIGQVYKGYLSEYGNVAIKVKRPGINKVVERDAALLRTMAGWLEAIPGLPGSKRRLIAANLVWAVEEFMSRLFEELDYRHEVANMKTFADLYSIKRGTSKRIRVVVPDVYDLLCSDRVIVMEWIDGIKLDKIDSMNSAIMEENLALIEEGIECTLSQLLDVGVLHADPHSGNLMKVRMPDGAVKLGYLDFGIISTVDEQVRDGLVCAIVQLIFSRDIEAVASLFGELQLLPQTVLDDPKERTALIDALDKTFLEVLTYPPCGEHKHVEIPTLHFDNLLSTMLSLIGRFEFVLPPYFLNNARALATLEGMAKRIDPSFNVLTVAYPYALNRLLNNASTSPIVEKTMLSLFRSPATHLVEAQRIKDVLQESARLTESSRGRIFFDVAVSKGGRTIAPIITRELLQTKQLRVISKKKEKAIPRQRFFRL